MYGRTELSPHEAAFEATLVRQLLPDLTTIAEANCAERLIDDVQAINQQHIEHANDGYEHHRWQMQREIGRMLRLVLGCDSEVATKYARQAFCYPRRREYCNAVKNLAAEIRAKEGGE